MQNVQRKTARDSGRACYGWTFNQRFSVHGPYVYLQHHAVWESPNSQLLDVTPPASNQALRPMTLNRGTLFLADATAAPAIHPTFGLAALPSRFFALRGGDALRDYMADLNEKELAAPHTLGIVTY